MLHSSEQVKKFYVGTVIFLSIVGIIMVFSSSYIFAKEMFDNSFHFFIRQSIFALLGIVLMVLFAKTNFLFWVRVNKFVLFIVTILMILTLVPGFSGTAKGASRWLQLGGVGIQPGEFFKLSLILFASNYFKDFNIYTSSQKIYNITLPALGLFILLLQPDFGSFSICLLLIFYLGFLSEVPRKLLYMTSTIGTISATMLLFLAPYRMNRILTFLDPWKDPQGSGFQIIQSWLAFANGSVFGLGIGNSHEKLFYLPEAHNDFIFSVIGEELGFIGVVIVVFAFIVLSYLGFQLALKCEKTISRLFIASATFLIGFQAFVNMGVVLGILPTKGLNLPFISSGGSSLISNFIMVGLIISALKFSQEQENRVQSQVVQSSFREEPNFDRQTYREDSLGDNFSQLRERLAQRRSKPAHSGFSAWSQAVNDKKERETKLKSWFK